MKYLFNKWDEVFSKIKDAAHILLASDYDGTLIPIADNPNSAVLSKKSKVIINNIASCSFITTVIISGRSLADIKKRIGIRNICYVGEYGIEIESPKLQFSLPEANKYKLVMLFVREDLEKKLKRIKGVVIENKKFSFSVHYRQVNTKDIKKLKDIFYTTIEQYVTSKKIEIFCGKKVLIAQPVIQVNKGKIISWMARDLSVIYHNVLSVYMGDDNTDESAFSAVNKKKGLSIFIGKRRGKSNAKYYLEDSCEVMEFLKKVKKAAKDK